MTREHVSSSNLKSVGYSPIQMVLEVEFLNGSIYRYSSVPQRIYEALMTASSHGKFFCRFIRNNFRYQRIY